MSLPSAYIINQKLLAIWRGGPVFPYSARSSGRQALPSNSRLHSLFGQLVALLQHCQSTIKTSWLLQGFYHHMPG